MTLKEPESMDECFYFTNRTIEDGKGNAMSWVFRPDCPKCGKAKMGKPVDAKTGKVKTRAKEYVCPACHYEVPMEEFSDTLIMNIKYTCPYCGNEGEATTQYKLKTFKGVKAYVFECSKCKEKIGITKKMKEIKKK